MFRLLSRERASRIVTFTLHHESPPFPPAIPRRFRLCFRTCHPEREVAKLNISGRVDRCGGNGWEHDDERVAASEGADCGDV